MYYSNKTIRRILASILVLSTILYLSEINAYSSDKYFLPAEYLRSENKSLNVLSTNIAEQKNNIYPEFNTNCKILLYHTHTNEAYLQSAENRYEHLASRSNDETLTVREVGNSLCSELAKLGYDSDHDSSDNEVQGYNNAYTLSDALINKNISENGKYLVHIDLHRDAYAKNTVPTMEIDGKSVAKIMFVVGGKCDNSDENYKFALSVADELNSEHPGLCEKVLFVKTSRYNQQYSNRSLLIEIGDNAVTVEEACNATQYVAQAIGKVLSKENALAD